MLTWIFKVLWWIQRRWAERNDVYVPSRMEKRYDR